MESDNFTPPATVNCESPREAMFSTYFDPAGFRLFSLGQRHGENAVLVRRRDLLRIDIRRETEGSAKGSPANFMREISPIVLEAIALPFTFDG
jgi:hypothetical protein